MHRKGFFIFFKKKERTRKLNKKQSNRGSNKSKLIRYKLRTWLKNSNYIFSECLKLDFIFPAN